MATGKTKEALLQEHSSSTKDQDGLKIYQLKSKVKWKDEANKIQVLTIGHENNAPIKCSLLVGETGAGKTQLINAFINHIFGIHFEDSFRIQLKDQLVGEPRQATQSQTDYITAYIIYHQEGMLYQDNFMFIDTPGLADTRGQKYQDITFKKLTAFFLNNSGIDDLNCIGIVAKANENRILEHNKQILKEITSLFGRDCGHIICLFCTFACDDAPVVEVVKGSGILFISAYRFDNYPLYYSNCLHPNLTERWKNTNTEYGKFFEDLQMSSSVSVKRTRELHKKKKLLEILEIELGEAANNLSALLRHNEENTRIIVEIRGKAGEIKWTEIKEKEIRSIETMVDGQHVHNCKKCERTCRTCEDPSNAIAAVVGAGSGAGTAVAAGVGTSLASGAIIGAEVGIFGGPIGVVIGAGVGTVVGLTVGLTTGLLSRKNKLNCPLAAEKCNSDGCTHKSSDHEISLNKVTINISKEEVIDKFKKSNYDKLVLKIQNLEAETTQREKEMKEIKKKATQMVLNLVRITKEISDLSLESDIINPEAIIDKIKAKRLDVFHFDILKWLKEQINV